MQFVSFDKARCYALFFSEINFSFFFFFSLLIDQREVSSISKFWNEIRIVGKKCRVIFDFNYFARNKSTVVSFFLARFFG